MPLIAQICMVVVTIAVAVMAVVAIRLMSEIKVLIQNANTSLAELPGLIKDVKKTSEKAEELLHAFSRITKSATAGVSGLEAVATRTSQMASGLLDGVERPISNTIRVFNGIRFGANFLIERWKARAIKHKQTTQGEDHVREQQWLDDGGIPTGRGGRRWSGSGPGTDGR